MKHRELENKVEYLVVMVDEFAKHHHLTNREAFRYLDEYKAIEFLDRHYEIAHTLSMNDVVNDLTTYCSFRGGTLS